MKLPLFRILTILLILAAASLACNFPAMSGPSRPPTPQPLNPDEVQQLEDQLKATLENADPSGDVTVNITEQQLNAFLIDEMAKQPEQIITDPQVELTDGHMDIYGKISQSGISADTKIVLRPRIDGDGSPKLDVESISLGGFPAPDALNSSISSLVDNTLSDYLAAGSNRFQVKTINIVEDQMTITGTPQP